MPRLLADITPLKESRAFRRLYIGTTLSATGTQLTLVAVSLQVYALTSSSLSVGLLGLFALVPLVVAGLYGGAIADAHDRRKVALFSGLALWLTTIAIAAQAWAGLNNVWLLYLLVAVQSGAAGVNQPTRSSIIPRLVRPELLPAIGAVLIGGGEFTVGILLAAVAFGSVLAGLFSGPLGRIHRQGLAVLWSIVGWGASVSAFGLVVVAAGATGPGAGGAVTPWIIPAALCLVLAGISDSVSSVFRSTILQSATPDAMRGRLQGVFIVVVAGGPRLGDMVAGGGAEWLGEGWTPVIGGLLCIALVGLLAKWQPRFARYDSRSPQA